MRTSLLVLAALALAWVAGAAAQLESEDIDVSADVAGAISTFPYRNCDTSAGAYQLAPNVTSTGSGKYCYTIKVNDQGCTGACCATDLKKIEFDVSDSCVVSPVAVAKATINGVPTTVGANFYRLAHGPTNAAVLRLSFLGLDTATARNAELCLTLSTNRAGKGCDTLEKMCVSPPGTPPGTCRAAFFDTSCKCCPVSQTFVPPPSQPPIVNVNCPTKVCITSQLVPPLYDVRPYRYDNASCATIQEEIADSMNSLIRESSIPMNSYFAPDPTQCSDTAVGVCGVFNRSTDLQDPSFKAEVQALVPGWIYVAGGDKICDPELEGYSVQVTTSDHPCLNVFQSVHCDPPVGNRFPNCTCNMTQGILPFTVSPRYFPGNNTATTTEYCFSVNTIPASQLVPSTCGVDGDKLTKIEWYANQNMSSFVRGFTLYPAVGPATRLSPSWGAQGAYTLKATNINWNITQASGGVVCVEVRNSKTMADLCLGFGGQCSVSIFNANKDCCPIYRTGFEDKP